MWLLAGRAHHDPAIRNLGSRANPAFAQNTAVDGSVPHPTRKYGTRPGMAKPGGRRMPKRRCAQIGGMVLQDLGEI